MNGQSVAGEDRDAHAGARDLQHRNIQDLAGFVAQLLFLIGFQGAVIDEVAGHRQGVIGDRCHVRAKVFVIKRGTIVDQAHIVLANGIDLCGQRLHAGQTGAGHRLVGGHVELIQASGIVEDLQHWHGSHGGAVRVRDDALRGVLGCLGVDLGNDEGNLWVLAVGRGIIHHGRAGRGEYRGPLLRGGATGGEQGNIDVGNGLLGDLSEVFYGNLLAAKFQLGAGGARRGKKAHLIRREIAFFQDGAHNAADLAGSAYDCNSGHDLKILCSCFLGI